MLGLPTDQATLLWDAPVEMLVAIEIFRSGTLTSKPAVEMAVAIEIFRSGVLTTSNKPAFDPAAQLSQAFSHHTWSATSNSRILQASCTV